MPTSNVQVCVFYFSKLINVRMILSISECRICSTARGFIRNKATLEDLQELEHLIEERKKDLARY